MSESQLELPEPGTAVHFVGIGGIGMSGLARILNSWGYRVSGSDASASALTDELSAEGIDVGIGHNMTERASRAQLVVNSAAVRSDNPELAAAEAAGVPVIKRAQLLAMLAAKQKSIAVAGTHGKSSTSGMLISALIDQGEEPAYAIGAVLAATGTNASPGNSDVMVVEADEYDRSFLWLSPDIAVISNVEFDHPDIFRDQSECENAFAEFLQRINPSGLAIVAGDDPGVQRVLALLPGSTSFQVVTFGEIGDEDWTIDRKGDSWHVRRRNEDWLPLRLSVPGRHNVRNATAAIIAMHALGITTAEAIASLERYTGIGRRFEGVGECNGVTVIDDYAHHPTEVLATIEAARNRFPDRRLVTVFQPHTFSRTKALLDDFAAALSQADHVILLDIYPSRETDDLGISSADLAERLQGTISTASGPAAAAELLLEVVSPGDVVLTMGAGDVTRTGPLFLSSQCNKGGDQH